MHSKVGWESQHRAIEAIKEVIKIRGSKTKKSGQITGLIVALSTSLLL
ncbi:hypothetical protein VCR29J2_70235 [Vibrio coralliirubri]|nr:hypothetical protein VCR29J2_70235 [Vibrio coralliirubri]